MKSSVEHLNDTRVKLTVEVSFDEMKPEFDQAYEAIAQQISIPGFRKGKAPRQLIEARVGRGPVLEQVLNDVVPSRYEQALEEHKLVALGAPTWDLSKVEDGEYIEFVAETDIRPEITVPDFADISVEVPAIEVSDEDLVAELDRLRSRFASLVEVERAAQEGDFVSVDVVTLEDGEPVEDTASKDLSHEVGSEEATEGLNDALVGMSKGDVKEFQSSALGDGEAKPETKRVTVNSVKARELPEADDEFAQLASEFDTIDELRENLKSSLEDYAKNSQAAAIRDEVLKAALEKTDFPLPEGVVQAQVDGNLQQLLGQLGGDESKLDTLLEAQGTTRDQFNEDSRTNAQDAVRTQLFLDVLAEQEQPSVSQQEFTDHVMFTAQSYGMEPMQFITQLQQTGQIGNVFADLRRGKALAAAICKTTVTDSNGEAVDAKAYFGEEDDTPAETTEQQD